VAAVAELVDGGNLTAADALVAHGPTTVERAPRLRALRLRDVGTLREEGVGPGRRSFAPGVVAEHGLDGRPLRLRGLRRDRKIHTDAG
jgi:hypothetical protein